MSRRRFLSGLVAIVAWTGAAQCREPSRSLIPPPARVSTSTNTMASRWPIPIAGSRPMYVSWRRFPSGSLPQNPCSPQSISMRRPNARRFAGDFRSYGTTRGIRGRRKPGRATQYFATMAYRTTRRSMSSKRSMASHGCFSIPTPGPRMARSHWPRCRSVSTADIWRTACRKPDRIGRRGGSSTCRPASRWRTH